MTLEAAFDTLRTSLNTALVPADVPHMVSMTPKHPDLVEQDDEFPYVCMEYVGEMPEYEADIKWIQASREMAGVKLYVAVNQSETNSLSLDLIKLVAKVRAVISNLTMSQNNFRIKVDSVETEYEPSGRWALATVTVTVGAYGT